MTQLFSVIMAIVMAFSAIGGMTATLEEPVSFEAQIGADIQTLMAMSGNTASGQEESFQQTVKLLEDVLGVLSLKGVADRESAELALFAGSDPVLNLGVQKTDGGMTFASNLLGSQTLVFSDEMIQQLQQQMMASMAQGGSGPNFQEVLGKLQSMDWTQIGADVSEALTAVTSKIMEKNGEPETGEFTVDGATFTVKVPNTITFDELTETALLAVKDLLGKESVQPLAQMLSPGKDPVESIEQALEDQKNRPAEDKPELTAAMYSNGEATSSYLVADALTKGTEDGVLEDVNVHFGLGQVEGQTRIVVSSNQANFDLTAGQAEEGYAVSAALKGQGIDAALASVTSADGSADITLDATIQGMPVREHTVITPDGERTRFQSEVYMMNAEKPTVTISCSSGKGGEKVSVYEGEDITAVPFEQLMNPEDTTAATQLQVTMMSKLMEAMVTLQKNLPEDSAAGLAGIVTQMMNPGPPTVTVPEGGPVADGE